MIRARTSAGLALLPLLAAPLLAQETEPKAPKRDPPLVRAVLHSFGRVERRAREFATLAGRPALEGFALGLIEGFLQAPAGGFAGLDRSRPIQVVVATPNPLGVPRAVFTLPVADRAAAEKTLRAIFPETVAEGDALRLQGGPANLAARFEASDATLRIAPTIDALTSVDAALPEQDADGPDLLVRWDADATRRLYADAWRTMREELRQSLRSARAGLLETAVDDPVERAAQEMLCDSTARAVERAADDFAGAELRMTIAPAGWETSLSARMRAGSPSAAFLDRIGSPGFAMPPPPPATLFRLEGAAGMTDELKTLGRAILDAARNRPDPKPDPALDPDEARRRDEQVLNGLQRLFAQPALGFSLDFAAGPALDSPELTVCVLLDKAGPETEAWMDFLSRTHAISRNVARHGGTGIHRIGPRKGGERAADAAKDFDLHVAAEGNCLALGTSLEAVKRQLDRIRLAPARTAAGAARPAGRSPAAGALSRVDLYLGRLTRAIWKDAPYVVHDDPAVRRFLERLSPEGEPPFTIDLRAGGGSLTLRAAIPGTILHALAEAAAEKAAPSGGSAPDGDK